MAKIYHEIKKLLEDEAVETQEDIKIALAQKGFKVTQSTISRNLKKMGAIKVIEQEQAKYKLPPEKLSFKGFSSFVKQIDHNGHLIVMKNHPGTANTVCEYLDHLQLENIMGTIAGDNTILIVPSDVTQIEALKKQLAKIFTES